MIAIIIIAIIIIAIIIIIIIAIVIIASHADSRINPACTYYRAYLGGGDSGNEHM